MGDAGDGVVTAEGKQYESWRK